MSAAKKHVLEMVKKLSGNVVPHSAVKRCFLKNSPR